MPESLKQVELVRADLATGGVITEPVAIKVSSDRSHFLGRGLECSAVKRVWVDGNAYAFKQMESPDKIEHAFSMWRQLRDLKVPTPDTYSMVKEDGLLIGLLMTELTENWQKILISTNQTKLDTLNQVNLVHPGLVKQFREYDLNDPGNLKEFEGQVEMIAERTARGRIFFDRKDITSAIFGGNPDLALILSDLGSLKKKPEFAFDILYNNNAIKLRRFKDHLEDGQYFASLV